MSMQIDYNGLLSEYDYKGNVGLEEVEDEPDVINQRIKTIFDHWNAAKNVVLLTGAGVSVSAGIQDFRGKNGVWTLSERVKKVDAIDFEGVVPTSVHMSMVELENQQKIQWLISQNVDNLHIMSGFPFDRLSEIHGNLFKEKCNRCRKCFINKSPVHSVGFQETGPCPGTGGRPCRGKLHDTLLDWESAIAEDDVSNCVRVLEKECDMLIAIGTTLQMHPVSDWVENAKKKKSPYFVIVNLQETPLDNIADVVLHCRAEHFFDQVMSNFGYEIPEYIPKGIVNCSKHNASTSRRKRHMSNDVAFEKIPTRQVKLDDEENQSPAHQHEDEAIVANQENDNDERQENQVHEEYRDEQEDPEFAEPPRVEEENCVANGAGPSQADNVEIVVVDAILDREIKQEEYGGYDDEGFPVEIEVNDTNSQEENAIPNEAMGSDAVELDVFGGYNDN